MTTIMNEWYKTDDLTKIRAYKHIASETGLTAYAVEKDWWVVQTLSIVFNLDVGKYMVFKGGTSLSKAWNIIERFSEDIDLAVDRTFFGFDGELSKSQRTKLRKASNEYLSNVFYTELIEKFKENGLFSVDIKIKDAVSKDEDPRIIEIYYPNVIDSPGYIKPKIQLEIGARSLREPYTIKNISSLIDTFYSDKSFAQEAIKIPTVNPERTFLEKIFLLHEEFQRPKDKIRVKRLSRHLYDIYQLSKTTFADKILNDKDLYQTIVTHRYSMTRLGGVNYNLHQPQFINPIPPDEFIKKWENDYKIMLEEMIYGDAPDFEELIAEITKFISKLNNVKWQMDISFPNPNQ